MDTVEKVVAGSGLFVTFVGWCVRLEARLNGKLSRVDHDLICKLNWEHIDKRFEELKDTLQQNNERIEKEDERKAMEAKELREALERLEIRKLADAKELRESLERRERDTLAYRQKSDEEAHKYQHDLKNRFNELKLDLAVMKSKLER